MLIHGAFSICPVFTLVVLETALENSTFRNRMGGIFEIL
jgi:hypothetical protein